jgi:Outer membrane receptor for ferrienterochelin and colicins
VTGAIDSLPAETLEGRHVTDVAELLKGRVSGLQVIRLPNGDISLRIRGSDSITQDGEPLLVIDGMPVSEQNLTGALRSLSPHEIASIEVLKDVSSTAFYGIRGAHGVILITTKRD